MRLILTMNFFFDSDKKGDDTAKTNRLLKRCSVTIKEVVPKLEFIDCWCYHKRKLLGYWKGFESSENWIKTE